MMIRSRLALLSILIFALALPVLAAPPQFQLHSKAAILMEVSGGEILYEFNADEQLPMASVTKIMTLAILLEALHSGEFDWEDWVVASENAKVLGGSQIWLEVGEQMKAKDLLYAIAVGSANDAAVAMAEFLSGTEADFVERMNAKAADLGLKNTHFVNASGLGEEDHKAIEGSHYSSARDLAIISRYAMNIPDFRNLVSTWEYTVRPGQRGEVILYNYNRMLKQYQGLDGIKTGLIDKAGYCLSATAQREGLRLVAVVLGAPTPTHRSHDVATMLDWGFRTYRAESLAEEGQVLAKVEISKGILKDVELVAGTPLLVTIPRGEKLEVTLSLEIPERLAAPVVVGQVYGRVVARLGDKELASAPLVAATGVERGGFFFLTGRSIREIMTGVFTPSTKKE